MQREVDVSALPNTPEHPNLNTTPPAPHPRWHSIPRDRWSSAILASSVCSCRRCSPAISLRRRPRATSCWSWVYRRTSRAQQSPAALALYIINFPQLIAGPIIRYHLIADQLDNRSVAFADIDIGVARFATDLAKKLLIANPIGAVADQLFSTSPADLPIWAVGWAAVLRAADLFRDFSGYSDIAIGLERMFGFRFPENFNYPYTATSIQDFWRQGHMMLSSWFRDYLYFPLGGSRGWTWMTVRNLRAASVPTGLRPCVREALRVASIR